MNEEFCTLFANNVIDTGGAPWLVNSSANFQKSRHDPNIIFRGLREDDSWKKPEAKNLVSLSLKNREKKEFLFM